MHELLSERKSMMISLYVLAFLCIDNQIIMLKRSANASFGAGLYCLPGGKVEVQETARQAIKREVQEETGLVLNESDFVLVHTFHRKATEHSLVALVFKADVAGMKPINNEPDKHDELVQINTAQIPESTLPAHWQAIAAIMHDVAYTEHGW